MRIQDGMFEAHPDMVSKDPEKIKKRKAARKNMIDSFKSAADYIPAVKGGKTLYKMYQSNKDKLGGMAEKAIPKKKPKRPERYNI